MSTSSTNPGGPQQRTVGSASNEAVRGLLVGLIPLGLLLVVVLVVLVLVVLARTLLSAAGFFVEQQVSLIILIVGFLATLIVSIIVTARTLRNIATWQQDSLTVRSRFALWALGFTALVVILPVLLALLLPQHPAP